MPWIAAAAIMVGAVKSRLVLDPGDAPPEGAPLDPRHEESAVLQFTRSYMAHVAGWHVVAETQRHIYEHLQRLSLRFYEDKQTGHLMSRMVNDSDMFERLIAHAVPDLAVNVLTLLGVGAVLLTINVRLMLISMIPIPFIILAMAASRLPR